MFYVIYPEPTEFLNISNFFENIGNFLKFWKFLKFLENLDFLEGKFRNMISKVRGTLWRREGYIDPKLINETNLQHEAKRKKFQNQDSVISEKFASKVNQTNNKHLHFRGKTLVLQQDETQEAQDGWTFHISIRAAAKIFSLYSAYIWSNRSYV